MELRDVLTIAALLFGPVVAVQTDKWMEGNEATGATPLAEMSKDQQPDHLPMDLRAESATYAVYAAVLRSAKPPVILMRETEWTANSCSALLSELSGEWREVAQDFRDRNARTWLLQPGASLGFDYRLISRAEIEVDDARLAKEYPFRSNAPRPGSIKYIAVSAVGFNAARTKALVYVRNRTTSFSDGLMPLILSGGSWVRDPNGRSCAGVASAMTGRTLRKARCRW
jgi:hypothetical protein